MAIGNDFLCDCIGSWTGKSCQGAERINSSQPNENETNKFANVYFNHGHLRLRYIRSAVRRSLKKKPF